MRGDRHGIHRPGRAKPRIGHLGVEPEDRQFVRRRCGETESEPAFQIQTARGPRDGAPAGVLQPDARAGAAQVATQTVFRGHIAADQAPGHRVAGELAQPHREGGLRSGQHRHGELDSGGAGGGFEAIGARGSARHDFKLGFGTSLLVGSHRARRERSAIGGESAHRDGAITGRIACARVRDPYVEADALADAVGGAITAQQDAVGRYQADGPVYKVTAQGRLGDDQQTRRAFARGYCEGWLNRAGGIGAACCQLDDLGPRAREEHTDRGIRDGALVGVSEEDNADRSGQARGPAILPEKMHFLSAERPS